jgi:hypothetical protein
MTNEFTATEETYWIAHDSKKVWANGVLEAGETVSTGQPYLDTFTGPRAYNARLVELGWTPD